MPKAQFSANWDAAWQKKYNVPKGYLIIKPKDVYVKNLGKVLNKLAEWQHNKGELRDLDFNFEYHYNKRTPAMNNLMWALYDIEAHELNGGMQAGKGQFVSPEDLYSQDLIDFAPRATIEVPESNAPFIREAYRIEKEEAIKDKNGAKIGIKFTVLIGSSSFDTFQMSRWLDRLFNRLACNGVAVTNPAEIHDYWVKWRTHLNENKIVLNDEILTREEYKARNPICEATGEYIGDGTGELSHINAVGMGGNAEPWKNYASNWFHFKTEVHREEWHRMPVEDFIKKYPWCSYKALTALKRVYEPLPEWAQTHEIKNIVEKHEEAKENAAQAQGERFLYYHTESETLYVGDKQGGEAVSDLYEIGPVSDLTKIEKVVLDMVGRNAVDKAQACTVFEQLGLDATKIDPKWMGIF